MSNEIIGEDAKIDPKKVEAFVKKSKKTIAVLGKICSINGWARDSYQLQIFTDEITGVMKSLESVGETKLAKAADNLLSGAKLDNYTFLAVTVPDFLKKLNEAAKALKDSQSGENSGVADLAKASPSNVFAGKRIMVVDDSATNRRVIFSVLTQKGAEIIEGKDGTDAVSIYKERKGGIDLILMDLDMPQMDGIEAAKLIRDSGLPGCENVPILVLSANLNNRKFKRMNQACFNDFMSKPVMPQILYNAMEKYLRK